MTPLSAELKAARILDSLGPWTGWRRPPLGLNQGLDHFCKNVNGEAFFIMKP